MNEFVSFEPKFLANVSSLGDVKYAKGKGYAHHNIREGYRLLDIGCGLGTDALELAKRLEAVGGHVTGVDRDERMIRYARAAADKLSLSADFRVGDINDLPFSPASFDSIRIDRVLHFLSDPAASLKRALTVLEAHGEVVVTEPNWETFSIQGGTEHVSRIIANYASQRSRSFNIGGKLPDLFSACGLEVLNHEFTELRVTDLTLGQGVFFLRQLAISVVQIGLVTAPDASRWLKSLSDANDEGKFSASLGGAIASGVRHP